MEPDKTAGTGFIETYAPLPAVIGIGLIVVFLMFGSPNRETRSLSGNASQDEIIPAKGVELPVTWGDIGAKLMESGALDVEKLKALYKDRGGFTPEYERMLKNSATGKIVITSQNAGYLLNLLWGLGLANKNPILEAKDGMMNPAYSGAGGFASTGGWPLAHGDPMDHYNKHALIVLTEDEQALVDRVSRNIYRPCCGNSTHFPDCNHGMAMLALLELMASQGVNEEEMYRAALAVNAYWFPDTYLTIAAYERQQGVPWQNVSPKEVLGARYSSSSGYQDIYAKVQKPPEEKSGGGCSA